MPFLELILQAELSRYEDDDFAEYALRYCDEHPDTRDVAIKNLRNMIYERGEFKPRRTDDAYLLRFLRARRFVPARAHRLMARYEEFRMRYASMYQGVDVFGLAHVKATYEGIVPDSPVWGRICIFRLGNWDPSGSSAEDVMRLGILMGEMGSMQPKLQILGYTIILDLEGFGVPQARCFSIENLKTLITFMGACPNVIRGVHILNSSWMFNALFNVSRPFIPAAAWSIVYNHGSDLGSLRQQIDPANLPPRYGGHCQYLVPSEVWLEKVKKFKDDFLTEDLRSLGYIVRD